MPPRALCVLIETRGEEAVLRDHLVQPAHSLESKSTPQSERHVPQVSCGSGATLHLLLSLRLPMSAIFLSQVKAARRTLKAGRFWNGRAGRAWRDPFSCPLYRQQDTPWVMQGGGVGTRPELSVCEWPPALSQLPHLASLFSPGSEM